MITKLKSHTFIDTLTFELADPANSILNAVLKDEEGRICNSLETALSPDVKTFSWTGFNHLPYGIYTLELSANAEKRVLSLVKRV